jgi:hypothetical protein
MGATFFAAFAAFAVGIICFSAIIYIIDVIGMFKVFEKCGLEGWKAIIPFYNDYVFAEKVWVPNYVLCLWIACIVNWVIVSPISHSGGFIGILFSLVGFILSIFFIVVRGRFCYWIAKSFGYDVGFAVGLFFLPFVFYLILGFGAAEYRGNVFLESGSQY